MSGSSRARAARSAFAGVARRDRPAQGSNLLRLRRPHHPGHLRVGGQRRHQRVQRQPVGQVARAQHHLAPQHGIADVHRRVVGADGGGGALGQLLHAREGRRVGALGAPAGRVHAHAGPQLQHRPGQVGRRLGARLQVQQDLQPAAVAPVAHARGAALADGHEPRLLQPLQRLAHGVAVDAQVLGQPALGRHRVAGRQRAGQDVGPQRRRARGRRCDPRRGSIVSRAVGAVAESGLLQLP